MRLKSLAISLLVFLIVIGTTRGIEYVDATNAVAQSTSSGGGGGGSTTKPTITDRTWDWLEGTSKYWVDSNNVFRMKVGQETLANIPNGYILIKFIKISENNKAIIEYTKFDYSGTAFEQEKLDLDANDIGKEIEVLKLGRDQALLVIPTELVKKIRYVETTSPGIVPGTAKPTTGPSVIVCKKTTKEDCKEAYKNWKEECEKRWNAWEASSGRDSADTKETEKGYEEKCNMDLEDWMEIYCNNLEICTSEPSTSTNSGREGGQSYDSKPGGDTATTGSEPTPSSEGFWYKLKDFFTSSTSTASSTPDGGISQSTKTTNTENK